MYDLDIYNQKVVSDNMTYSIDMLRLKTYVIYSHFLDLVDYIKLIYKDNIKKYWVSDKKMCFHYNYVIEFDTFSFYFAYMHNNESVNYNREDMQYNFTIEFNPNKAKDNSLILHILSKFANWFLRSFDLAIDIPINILDILFDIGRRRKVQTISYGGDNITYNYGNGDGRLKIYNKKNESNLNIVGHLTRVEITREFDDFPLLHLEKFVFSSDFFPTLFLNQYVFSFSDYTSKDKTLMALLYAVQSGYPLKDLSRRYREKIEMLLQGGSSISFNSQCAVEVFTNTILYYFNRKGFKQVFFNAREL